MAKKSSHGGNTAEIARGIVKPIVEQLGLVLWDVRFLKEGVLWYLRIYIDKPEGVTIDDCENVSRAVDAPLDNANFIDQAYYLEVSSPGTERELTRPEHFAALEGCAVVLHRIRPDENGEREIAGILTGLREECVVITTEDGAEVSAPRRELSAVTLIDDFDGEDEPEP